MPGSRSWCFTINNDDYDDFMEIVRTPFKYCCFGFEIGKKGTEHIQGYMQFDQPKTLKTVSGYLKTAHLEVAKGTPEQNISYCSKAGDFYEIGIKPTKGGRVTFEQVEEAFKDPDNNMTIIRQYGRAYEAAKQIKINQQQHKTLYYYYKPLHDWLTELSYAFSEEKIIVITEIQELAAYENEEYDIVVLLFQYMTPLLNFYPRGVPIKYKYGFEYHTCKPKRFIIVHDKDIESLENYKRIPFVKILDD